MKDIKNFHAPKYDTGKYIPVEDGIYKVADPEDGLYYTSVSFVQEPEYDEGENAADISQYPLEDLLDKFLVFISDFYAEMNSENSDRCYLEFAGSDLEDIRGLRSVIGKHVYNLEDGNVIRLIIE